MKIEIKKEFWIGLWSIIALVVMFLMTNFLKGVHTFRQGNFYYLVCDNVPGLNISSSITLHGLKVGIVRSLEYDQQSDQILVTLNLYDSDLRIPKDSRLTIKPDLLGSSDVVLEMGSSEQCYAAWDTIYAPKTPAGLLDKAEPMLGAVEALMPKIDSLVSGINVLVKESKLHESLLEINSLTSHLNQTVGQLNQLLRKDVPTIMANVKDATANLDSLSIQLKEAEVQQLLANANQTLTEANQLLKGLQSDEGTLGKLMNTTELHDQLNQTVQDIDSLVNDIKENPKRYIHIKVF